MSITSINPSVNEEYATAGASASKRRGAKKLLASSGEVVGEATSVDASSNCSSPRRKLSPRWDGEATYNHLAGGKFQAEATCLGPPMKLSCRRDDGETLPRQGRRGGRGDPLLLSLGPSGRHVPLLPRQESFMVLSIAVAHSSAGIWV